MADVDLLYADLIGRCLAGERVLTRNAWCRRAVCPPLAEFRTTPLVSARRTAWKTALREWEWFMSGSARLDDAHESVRPWWRPFARAGWLPMSYGHQFRRSGAADCVTPFDQIEHLVRGLRDHPHSRRHVVTTWHAEQMASGVCEPTTCHGTVIQYFVEGGALTLYAYQRSADVIVGLPHNWIAYWASLHWLARRAGLRPGRLIYQLGDAHVYEEHHSLALRILHAARETLPLAPVLLYDPPDGNASTFRADDFRLEGDYQPVIHERVEMIL